MNPHNTKAGQKHLLPLTSHFRWSRDLDLNQGPPGYEPDELPDCSTPQCVEFRIQFSMLRRVL